MKRAIFTIMVGDNPIYKYTKKAMESYAKKVNAELIILDYNKYVLDKPNQKHGYSPEKAAWAQKLHLATLLENYDRVLYLDGDVLITPHAPDIFVEYSSLDVVYMLNEGLYIDRSKPVKQILSFFQLTRPWQKKQDKYSYCNVGVMLLSKQANPFKFSKLSDLTKIYKDVELYEQTYINYLIMQHNISLESLLPEYNRMDMFGNDEKRLEAYFIHYAGSGYSKTYELRYRTLIADYYCLYGETDCHFVRFLKNQKYHFIYYRKKLRRLFSKIKKWSKNPRYYLFRKKN